ncbi:unnamed protein product [Brugia timori]|uniref:Secreted protein n=1 Tax=Brugia timori TaxID=42155 RepID=A0A0R3Q6R8_9BILA|nr:unnamed protein product [Brugia timori]
MLYIISWHKNRKSVLSVVILSPFLVQNGARKTCTFFEHFSSVLARRGDDVLHDDIHGSYHKKHPERNPADEVWKHDMFECEESEGAEVAHVRDQL